MKNIKAGLAKTRSRKIKKRDFSKEFTVRINLSSHASYNSYARFVRDQKVQINRKILASLFITEKGASFSLWAWFALLQQKLI